MNRVLYLHQYTDEVSFYSGDATKAIKWLLPQDCHMLMLHGELADSTRGSILLLNSPAKLTILNPGESIKIPAGESAFLFFEPRIEEGFVGLTIDGRPNKDFKRVRTIYPKVSL